MCRAIKRLLTTIVSVIEASHRETSWLRRVYLIFAEEHGRALRNSHYRFSHLFTVVVTVQIALSDVALSNQFSLPQVTTQTTLSGTTILPGKSINVNVRVSGDARTQSIPIPARIVVVLDYSGSMSPNIEVLRTATNNLIDQLDSKYHEVAVVAFSDSVKLLSSPTTDFTKVKSAVNSHPVGGTTNIAAAFSEGRKQLKNAHQPVRFGILFTDGRPEPSHTVEQQRSEIKKVLDLLRHEEITFHTVGLGNVDSLLLDVMARRTGGAFTEISNASQISDIFVDIFEKNSKTLTTKSIQIKESLFSELRAEDGTFQSSFLAPTIDPDSFQNEIDQMIESFYKSSEIAFPVISEMGDKNYFSYSFDTAVNTCDEKGDKTIPLRAPQSSIVFRNGDKKPSAINFDSVQITVLRCGVYIYKTWDENERRIDITFHNALGQPVRDLSILDSMKAAFKINWSRIENFKLAPTSYYSPDGLAKWDLGIVDGQTKLEISFYVKETTAAVLGENPIQHQLDHGVKWKFDGPAFQILKSDLVYRSLENQLLSMGALSDKVLGFISHKMPYFDHLSIGLGVPIRLSSATVTLPPMNAANRGYTWAIEVSDVQGLESLHFVDGWGLEQTDWPLPGISLVSGDPFTIMTGFLYVKKTNYGYEIVPEFQEATELPQVWTTTQFIPSP